MIKNIFFDLDDTLLDFKRAEKISLVKMFTETGIEPKEELLKRYSEINAEEWGKLERKETTMEILLINRYRRLFDEYGIDKDPTAACGMYENNLAYGFYVMPFAVETLNQLYKKFNLYIASNGRTEIQTARLEKADMTKYFKGIFVSETVGCEKPDKQFFDYCFLHSGGAKKEDSIMVGNSLSSDIAGGGNAGIKTCLLCLDGKKERGNIKPDYIINSLKELPELLEKINRA